MKHIILIGFMGAGKSTMGKLIANKLECTFVDTDDYIEKKEGRSVLDIFADDGEEYFRNAETEALQELMQAEKRMVISLGGGTPLKEENRKIIKSGGFVIFLKLSAKEAFERLKDTGDRPLLNVDNPKERIEALLAVRNPIYESVADYVLIQDGKSLDDVFYELSRVVRDK